MKEITLKRAKSILEKCSAVIINENVTEPIVYSNESMFLELYYKDSYNSYNITFHDYDQESSITIFESKMSLIDCNGKKRCITVLYPLNLEQL